MNKQTQSGGRRGVGRTMPGMSGCISTARTRRQKGSPVTASPRPALRHCWSNCVFNSRGAQAHGEGALQPLELVILLCCFVDEILKCLGRFFLNRWGDNRFPSVLPPLPSPSDLFHPWELGVRRLTEFASKATKPGVVLGKGTRCFAPAAPTSRQQFMGHLISLRLCQVDGIEAKGLSRVSVRK